MTAREARLRTAAEAVAEAFARAGIGNDLPMLLAAIGVVAGTTCAASPDPHAALEAVTRVALDVMKGVEG
jgi:hypothetical protein